MKRSVLGIIFALTLLIGLFPALAAAESEDVTTTEVDSTSVESTEEVNTLADESLPSETEAATQAVTETATATQTETVVVTETATTVVTETATSTVTETETATATATQTDTPTETATATPIIIPAEASIGGTMECTYVTASIIGDTYTADKVLIQLIGNYSDGTQVYIFNDTVPYTGNPFIWNYEYEANGAESVDMYVGDPSGEGVEAESSIKCQTPEPLVFTSMSISCSGLFEFTKTGGSGLLGLNFILLHNGVEIDSHYDEIMRDFYSYDFAVDVSALDPPVVAVDVYTTDMSTKLGSVVSEGCGEAAATPLPIEASLEVVEFNCDNFSVSVQANREVTLRMAAYYTSNSADIVIQPVDYVASEGVYSIGPIPDTVRNEPITYVAFIFDSNVRVSEEVTCDSTETPVTPTPEDPEPEITGQVEVVSLNCETGNGSVWATGELGDLTISLENNAVSSSVVVEYTGEGLYAVSFGSPNLSGIAAVTVSADGAVSDVEAIDCAVPSMPDFSDEFVMWLVEEIIDILNEIIAETITEL